MTASAPVATPIWSAPLGNMVNSVAIADDASRVVAGTYFHNYPDDGATVFGTYAFDAKGNQLWQQLLPTSSEGAYWVALAAKGTYAASGGKLIDPKTGAPSGFIQAFDAANGKVLLDYRLPGADAGERVNKVALSADGSALAAVGGYSLYVAILQGDAYANPVAVPIMSGDDWVDTVAISGDGAWIVTGSSNGQVDVFANNGGAVTRKGTYVMAGGATCRCVSMTADGRWFGASGGSSKTGGLACLFDTTAAGPAMQPMWTHTSKGPIYYISLSAGAPGVPPLAAIVTNTPEQPSSSDAAQAPGQLSVLQMGRGPVPTVLNSFITLAPPNSASIDAAGKLVAAADGLGKSSPGNFYLLNAQSLQPIWTYPTAHMSWPIAIAARGGAVAAGSDDGSVYYFAV